MKFEELKKLDIKELNEELERSSLSLLKLRLNVATRQSKETSMLKALRKYIARIKTRKHMLKLERVKENPQSPVTQ